MIPAILAKIGIPVLSQIISDSLRDIDHPAAKGASKALGELDEVLKRGEITEGELIEANRHAETMAQIRASQYADQLGEINASLRAEVASQDAYVRRMRPTFGYLMALTWAAQMLGLAYVVVFKTGEASLVLEAVESLSMIWTVGLSVLGIYVYKRSEDKKNRMMR